MGCRAQEHLTGLMPGAVKVRARDAGATADSAAAAGEEGCTFEISRGRGEGEEPVPWKPPAAPW
jgi:hypothetical protein